MGSRVGTGHAKVGGAKIKDKVAREILNSDGAKSLIKSEADRIADGMTAEGHGEFRSGLGTRKGKTRAHAFVNTYDRQARRYANRHPDELRSLFNKNI